ncbi:hypothetical protein MTO96_020363 [Rhipicephalus appendiculatus]
MKYGTYGGERPPTPPYTNQGNPAVSRDEPHSWFDISIRQRPEGLVSVVNISIKIGRFGKPPTDGTTRSGGFLFFEIESRCTST